MTKAETFCRLNNIHWHKQHLPISKDYQNVGKCDCGYFARNQETMDNPTFQNTESIIEVMNKRRDYKKFQFFNKDKIFILYNQIWSDSCFSMISFEAAIKEYYVINSDELLDESINFCEDNKL